jgi:hypothetical protein
MTVTSGIVDTRGTPPARIALARWEFARITPRRESLTMSAVQRYYNPRATPPGGRQPQPLAEAMCGMRLPGA